MTISLGERGVRGVVLDIEGTTTPLAFVRDVLFPYARAQLRDFLSEYGEHPALLEAIRLLREERAADGVESELAEYVERLMDEDRKSLGLKLLQGQIWERGYRDGSLRGELFHDVPPALERWRTAGLDLAIFSSGSVLAQQLLFGHTRWGDLTRWFRHHFDTGTGPKQAPESYRRIAAAMGLESARLLFISDVAAELEAARAAGLQVLQCIRPGNAEPPAGNLESIGSFAELIG